MDFYSFYTGHCFDAHEWLGAHPSGTGFVFRTFAPGAERVSLLLDGREIPMRRVHDGNFYEHFEPNTYAGSCYEYRIYSGGAFRDHCDPFGFGMELRPAHRSVLRGLRSFTFSDDAWMRQRSACVDRPLNIYELHLGSWRKKGAGETDWYRYDELAGLLIPYLQEAGYNYVELLPVCEHPCDESWGYQNTGFFAPTSRYGSAEDLMRLIDRLHQAGIGVILDFVPVHFAVDAYALARYDGTALYEYPHADVGVSEWGSCNFMHARGEVRSFLQSSAHYWLSYYHFDGLRMDAVSRMVYWQGDESRGVNQDAVEFLRVMNAGLKALHPGCMLIAEDSTQYPQVTAPVEAGGLGFDYKWDMGWM
ncbi:MAG: alpha-amylase family glycosyl hydrolase, partial [Hominenteromicrobium sp.]